MKELKCQLQKPLKLLMDNKFVISLAKNPISHGRSKHTETRFHQLADGFTKEYLKSKLGLINA
jgi:hypothetical protein